jgi:hypothetical protein
VSRLWELAALAVLMVVVGAILATPTFPADARVGAIAAIVGGMLLMARMGRRRGPDQ